MSAYIIPISAASLLLIVVAVIVLRYALTPRIKAPLCGRCRYDVTGLPTDICPECGANLNEVGIMRPGSVKPMGPLMKLALWTLSVAAIGVIATPPILRTIPPLQQMTTTATLGSPRTGLYTSVSINGIRSWRGDDSTASTSVDVTLTRPDDLQFTMQASPERGLCWYTDDRGKTTRGLIPADDEDTAAKTVLEWMNACGIAASGDWLFSEAREIARSIAQTSDQRGTFQSSSRMLVGGMNGSIKSQIRNFSFGSSRSSTSARGLQFGMGAPYSSTSVVFNSGLVKDPWPRRLVIGGWGALWLMGVIVIVLIAARQHPGEPVRAIDVPSPQE